MSATSRQRATGGDCVSTAGESSWSAWVPEATFASTMTSVAGSRPKVVKTKLWPSTSSRNQSTPRTLKQGSGEGGGLAKPQRMMMATGSPQAAVDCAFTLRRLNPATSSGKRTIIFAHSGSFALAAGSRFTTGAQAAKINTPARISEITALVLRIDARFTVRGLTHSG